MASTPHGNEKPPPYSPPNYPQDATFNPNNPNYVLGPPPPPPGFQPYPPQMAPGPMNVPNYGSMPPNTTVVITQQPTDNIIIVGGCPACRVGVLEDDFTCLGIFCAIFFFPLGVLCCLALRDKRCSNCGAYFG